MVDSTNSPILPDILNNSIGFNLNRVNTLFRREMLRLLEPFNLTPEQWQILVILWNQKEPLNQNSISDTILKDKPSVSRMIARMEKNDWIVRRSAENDRRVTLISLTTKGEEYEKIIPKKIKKHFSSILKNFSSDNSEVLLSALHTLRTVFDDYHTDQE